MKKGGVVSGRWGVLLGASLCSLGCDEEKPPEPVKVEKKVEEAPPEPEVKSPPHFVISADGPSVRGTSVEGEQKSGILNTVERDKLRNYLADEKEFISGKELSVIVDRKAKRGWVGAYLEELGKLSPAKLTITTETRKEFSGSLPFVAPGQQGELDGCTMIGKITEHNGSVLWQVKGGAGKERGPGLGGPDLSMAKESIAKTYEKCESQVFITDGENNKEWGFIFDMAAAAISVPDSGIERAFLAPEPLTEGKPVKL